jgi:hypothetical protein
MENEQDLPYSKWKMKKIPPLTKCKKLNPSEKERGGEV